MSIKQSISFFHELEKNPEIKNIFYQYSTLTGLCQYEKLFNYIATIQNRENLNVLDWGCGNGWFSYYLIKAGFKKVTSYGYGWDSIDEAKKHIPEINYVNGAEVTLDNPSKIPFEDKSFDIVFSIGVLEHVHETGGDQLLSLFEINRILKPNGKFFCYHLPNKLTWIEFLKGLIVKDKAKYFLHTRKFDDNDVKSLSLKSNFNVISIKRYNVLPYNIFRKNVFDTAILAKAYSLLDNGLLLTPLNFLSQCYLYEAQKKSDT